MTNKSFVTGCLAWGCLGIYLFANAPPPLEQSKPASAVIPVERMFEILRQENDVVRALWTRDIVGAGKQAGLKFDEHWREPDIEAGPLPALFLRETAKSLEKNPTPLALFLGSDYPINDANRFEGQQLERFQALKQTLQPQFFFMADIKMQVAMFGDRAVSETCIQCHNAHDQSPKRDWKFNDVMGATTWMYPKAAVSLEELVRTIEALHGGFRDAYQAYIAKANTFASPPAIGDNWPSEGYCLPTPDVFMGEILKRAAPHTLTALASLAVGANDHSAVANRTGAPNDVSP